MQTYDGKNIVVDSFMLTLVVVMQVQNILINLAHQEIATPKDFFFLLRVANYFNMEMSANIGTSLSG